MVLYNKTTHLSRANLLQIVFQFEFLCERPQIRRYFGVQGDALTRAAIHFLVFLLAMNVNTLLTFYLRGTF